MSWRLAPWQPRWSRRLSQSVRPEQRQRQRRRRRGVRGGGAQRRHRRPASPSAAHELRTRVYLADAAALSLSDAAAAFTARDTGGEYSRGTTFWVGAADAAELRARAARARDLPLPRARRGLRPEDVGRRVVDAGDRRRGRRRRLPLRPRLRHGGRPGHPPPPAPRDGDLPHRRRRADARARAAVAAARAAAVHRAVPAAEACWPAAGRHLAFDGRMLHGAPSGLGGAPPARGRRCTFLVNVWLNHVPWGAERCKGGGGGRGGRALRLDAAPPVERVERRVAAGGGDARRWTFGDEKARLELRFRGRRNRCAAGLRASSLARAPPRVRPAPTRKRRRAS